MKKYKISVIMPVYNAEKYVSTSIKSILCQTYENLELLILDDASKDKTWKVINSFKDDRIKIFKNNKNLGYLKSCNKLFDLVTGDYVAFQDADDYSDQRRFEIQIKEFENDPSLAVCGTNFVALKENGEEMFCTIFPEDKETIMSRMLKNEYLFIPNSFLFKRFIINEIGGYNEFWDRMGCEDYYWTWLIMEKYKLKNIKQPLYFYRYNPKGITGDWSDNRKKFYSEKILSYIIKLRNESKEDPIETKDWITLNNLIKEFDKPFIEDPSLSWRELARRDFYSGNKKRALKYAFISIIKNPTNTANLKNFFYYLKNNP